MEEMRECPIEEVRLTVPTTDDPSLPTLTFRVWVMGIASSLIMYTMTEFFYFRQNPVFISSVCMQILMLPVGRLMAATLPEKPIKVPWTRWSFSLNPGPFNMKEHALAYLFLSSGSVPYSLVIINQLRIFYSRHVSLWAAFMLVQSTQLIGYAFAGLLMNLVVTSPHMWWPGVLADVTSFRALHEDETRKKGKLTGFQFLMIVAASSFAYYMIPNYFFPSITALSFVCWIWKDSVTMQQIGSGLHGLGLGSIALDWSAISGFLGSPLVTPAFAIFNTLAGFILILYIITPIAYWSNTFDAKRFPIFSSGIFDDNGQRYNVTRIINQKTYEFDRESYNNYSKLYQSVFYPFHIGFGLAATVASITHVAIFHGKSLWQKFKQAYKDQEEGDIHNQLMKKYDPVPSWWFLAVLIASYGLAFAVSEGFGKEFQLPFWGVLLATGMTLIFLVPLSVIQAISNQATQINTLHTLLIGYLYPGRAIAGLTFRSYGSMSMSNALAFLSDFKLGHYMKIPPRSMFIVQIAGGLASATISFSANWMLLSSVENICHPELLPEGSPWTCPYDRLIYNNNITWGVIGPRLLYYPDGQYAKIFLFFFAGLAAPLLVWLLAKAFPERKWIRLVNFPIIFTAGTIMPAATAVNYWSWVLVGLLFNVIIYKKFRVWWGERTYLLSIGLDLGGAGTAFLANIALQLQGIYGIQWWGLDLDDHCPLAQCPTAPGIRVEGCPTF